MSLFRSSLALLALAACASTEMRPYVGRPIQDVLLDYGAPEQVVTLTDGRRAYQYRWGGGTAVIPGSSVSTATTVGAITTVNTTASPAIIAESEGCLIAFIAARRDDGSEVVDEVRPPREVVC